MAGPSASAARFQPTKWASCTLFTTTCAGGKKARRWCSTHPAALRQAPREGTYRRSTGALNWISRTKEKNERVLGTIKLDRTPLRGGCRRGVFPGHQHCMDQAALRGLERHPEPDGSGEEAIGDL